MPFACQASPQGSTLGPAGTQPDQWPLARRLWRWRGDQGPQLAGGGDESPSVMRIWVRRVSRWILFCPQAQVQLHPPAPPQPALPGTCVQLGPRQRPLLLETQALLPAGVGSGLQAPFRGCDARWQVTCPLWPPSAHPSTGYVVVALASQGRKEVRIKTLCVKAPSGS